MGNKLWVSEVTLVLAKGILPIPSVEIVGMVLMVIGCVLIILDK